MNVTATRSEWRGGGGWWYIEKRQVGESAKCTVSIEKNDNSPSRKYIVFFLLHHHCHGKSSFSVRQTGLDATDMQHGSPSRFVNFSQTSHTTACYRWAGRGFFLGISFTLLHIFDSLCWCKSFSSHHSSQPIPHRQSIFYYKPSRCCQIYFIYGLVGALSTNMVYIVNCEHTFEIDRK